TADAVHVDLRAGVALQEEVEVREGVDRVPSGEQTEETAFIVEDRGAPALARHAHSQGFGRDVLDDDRGSGPDRGSLGAELLDRGDEAVALRVSLRARGLLLELLQLVGVDIKLESRCVEIDPVLRERRLLPVKYRARDPLEDRGLPLSGWEE